MDNVKLSEGLAVVGTIDPVANTSSVAYSDYVDMSKFHEIIAILLLGDMASQTIDFDLVAYSDTSASDTTVIISSTQLTGSTSANDDSQIVLSCTADQVRAGSDTAALRYVRAAFTPGGAVTGSTAVLVLAGKARFNPASSDDLSSVKEVKSS